MTNQLKELLTTLERFGNEADRRSARCGIA